jgi:hypothetical protein
MTTTYLILTAAGTIFEFFADDASAIRAAGADRLLRFDLATRTYVAVAR